MQLATLIQLELFAILNCSCSFFFFFASPTGQNSMKASHFGPTVTFYYFVREKNPIGPTVVFCNGKDLAAMQEFQIWPQTQSNFSWPLYLNMLQRERFIGTFDTMKLASLLQLKFSAQTSSCVNKNYRRYPIVQINPMVL